MRIAVAQRAVDDDESEEPLQVFAHVWRVRKLGKALHDRSLIAAAIFLISAAGVEHAEILKSAIGAVRPKVEAVNYERQRVFRKTVGRHFEAAFLGDLEAEEFIGRELWIFVLLPEFHDVCRAP